MVIYKYYVHAQHVQTILMPEGAKVLSVAEKDNELCMWALVDPSRPRIPRMVRVAMTGEEFGEGDLESFDFVGTVIMEDAIVAHVFVFRN